MRKPKGATLPESPKGAFPILKAALYFQKPRCMKVTQGDEDDDNQPVRAQTVREEEQEAATLLLPPLHPPQVS